MSKKEVIDRIVIHKGLDASEDKIGYTMTLRPKKPTIEFRPKNAQKVFCTNSPVIFSKYFQPFANWITGIDESNVSFYKHFNTKEECDSWCSDTIFCDDDLLWSVFMMSGDQCIVLGSYRFSDIPLPEVFYSVENPLKS